MKIFRCLPLIALFTVACADAGEEGEYTRQIQFDTMGTMGFDIRREIKGRVAQSPDPIMSARDVLMAEQGLCPDRFRVESFALDDEPPTLTFEARIRCI